MNIIAQSAASTPSETTGPVLMTITTCIRTCFLMLLIGSYATDAVASPPLKVYVLAGQSNMQGHAHVRTLDCMGAATDTAPILSRIRGEDGKDIVFDHIRISALGISDKERHGPLTTGFGAVAGGPKIGPELTFGIYMQQHVQQPILIIKTAWGGKSLHTDFRSPSAGPYQFTDQQTQKMQQQGKNLKKEQKDRVDATGVYYRLMLEHVRHVLSDIKRVYPDYDSNSGYELSGFVWFQGWNDMVDSGVYPNRSNSGGYDRYSEALTHFIRDVRKDLAAPKLPFVIGVMGAGGPVDQFGPTKKRNVAFHSEFRKAMSAPAALPEFRGNVHVVETAQSWDPLIGELSDRMGQVKAKRRRLNKQPELSVQQRKAEADKLTAELFTPKELAMLQAGASNAEYHYLGSAKILARIGKTFAEALYQHN